MIKPACRHIFVAQVGGEAVLGEPGRIDKDTLRELLGEPSQFVSFLFTHGEHFAALLRRVK